MKIPEACMNTGAESASPQDDAVHTIVIGRSESSS